MEEENQQSKPFIEQLLQLKKKDKRNFIFTRISVFLLLIAGLTFPVFGFLQKPKIRMEHFVFVIVSLVLILPAFILAERYNLSLRKFIKTPSKETLEYTNRKLNRFFLFPVIILGSLSLLITLLISAVIPRTKDYTRKVGVKALPLAIIGFIPVIFLVLATLVIFSEFFKGLNAPDAEPLPTIVWGIISLILLIYFVAFCLGVAMYSLFRCGLVFVKREKQEEDHLKGHKFLHTYLKYISYFMCVIGILALLFIYNNYTGDSAYFRRFKI